MTRISACIFVCIDVEDNVAEALKANKPITTEMYETLWRKQLRAEQVDIQSIEVEEADHT